MPARTRPFSGASFATLILVILVGVTCGEPFAPDAPRPRAVPLPPSLAVAGATANDLGTLGGTSSVPSALNDAGTVVGYSVNAAGQTRAFRWSPGGSMVDMGALGGTTSRALGINTAGEIVGSATINNGNQRAFRWTSAGGMVELSNTNGAEAVAITDASVATGWLLKQGTHRVFRWTSAGGMVELPTLGGTVGEPVGINGSGVIIGYSTTAAGQEHAFRSVSGTTVQDLGTLGGTTSRPRSINGGGNIVGYSTTASGATHAFRWTAAGGMQDLGTLGGTNSSAYANNDSSMVVGEAQTATGATHAFRWTPAGGMQDLGTLLGGTNSVAYAINAAGVVAGISDSPTGKRVFVWTAAGGMQDVGAVTGTTLQELKGINGNKHVLGRALSGTADRALRWVVTTNAPPVARIGGPYNGTEGVAISFSAAASTDLDADPLTYEWDFENDGVADLTTATAAATHAYADQGSFTAKVTVVDDDGVRSNATAAVTVANHVPAVTVPATATATINESFTLSGTTIDRGTNDGPWVVVFDWGDGTTNTSPAASLANALSASHTYTALGAYTVKLTVTDKDGATGTGQVALTVVSHPPLPSAGGPYTGQEGSAVTFDASGSADPDGDPLSYSWSFGDGRTGTGVAPTHTYRDNGSYTVTLTVSDGTGATSTATAAATIANVAPAVNAGPDAAADDFVPFTLTGTFSDAGTADNAWSYTINWGDGSPATTGSVASQGAISGTHQYAAGSYTATLTVSDKDGGTSNDAVVVTVAAVTPLASAGGPYTGAEGGAVTFDGSGSSDPNGDALAYSWNFGDGSTGTGVAPSHAYADNGAYTVTLTVSDPAGHSSSKITKATIANVAPAVDAGADVSGSEGLALTLSGSFSDAGSTDGAWSYTINWGDGSASTAGSRAAQGAISATHIYAAPGSFTATLSVTDKDGATTSDAVQVTVAAARPVASVGGPYASLEGSTVSFDGSGSSDPNGDALTYSWSFGDGSTGSGPAPTHTFRDNGSYTVTLTVTDGTGLTGTATATAAVANAAPAVSAGPDAAIDEGQTVTLGASFSDAGTADGAWSYTVVWGDGSANTTGSAASQGAIAPTHLYITPGTYTATLTVRDKDNATASDDIVVTVRAVKPLASAGGPYTSVEGGTVAFSAAGSSDPNGDALAYSWSFGDGRTGTGVAPTHAYADNGAYTVTLTVDDGNGHTASATTTATVTNATPVVNAGADAAIDEGQSLSLAGAFSDAGVADGPWPYAVSWGDGGANTTGSAASQGPVTAAHLFNAAGTFTVTLSVTDKDKATGSDAVVVIVRAVRPIARPGGPYTSVEGSAVSFDGSTSSDPNGDALTYSWSFGDGATGTGPTPTHTYADNGKYTVTLTVDDGNGHTSVAATTATVSNVAPAVNAGPDAAIDEAQSFTLSGSFSDPGVVDNAWTYAVTWGDGSPNTSGSVASQGAVSATKTFTAAGTYTVVLTVTDKDGGTASDNLLLTVRAVKPVARPGGPYTAVEGSVVAFDGSASSDPNGDPLTYNWSFGDGATATGPTASHSYVDNGKYTVTLTVNDGNGHITSASTTATISNATPVVNAGADAAMDDGQAFTLNASFGDAGVNDATWSYRIDWGDGTNKTGTTTSQGAISASRVVTAGTYTLTVSVTDKDGATGSDNLVLIVRGVTPVADAGGPYTVNEGTAVSFDGTGSSDPNGDPLTYAWDFTSDGIIDATTATATYTYPNNGNYTARLTVTDPAGHSSTATASVAVLSIIAGVDAGPDVTIVVGGSYRPSASFGDGAADGPWNIEMRWGDGAVTLATAIAPGSINLPSHTYSAIGAYTATITVTDKDGGKASDAAVVNVVANTAPVANANGPYSGNEGTSVQFSSAGSSDPNAQTLTYSWNFGDGTTSTSANPKKAYTDNGTYTVILIVKDVSGATDTAATTATIANVAPTATFTAPTSVSEGSAYTLSLSGTDAGTADRPTLEYAFECGQGAGWTDWSTTVKSASCAPLPDQGPAVTVQGQVKDKDGGVTVYTKAVNITNAVPVVTFAATSPTSAEPGGTITVAGSFTDKGANDGPWTYTLAWGDGATSTSTGSVDAQTDTISGSHAYALPGTYSATLSVKDKDGGSGTSAKVTFTIANDPPVANANGPYSGNEGASIQFSSAGSSDPDGQTLTYSWNFGDGTTSTSANPKKAYTDDGEYTVTLTVKDPTGGTATATTTATTTNVAPTATFTTPSTPEGTDYTLTLSGTDAGSADRSTLKYSFDCGQGAGWTAPSTTVKSVTCPALPDQQTVSVQGRVEDKDGGVTVYPKAVTITNAAPVVVLSATSPTTFEPGGSVSVEGSFTDRGANDAPWSYTISWGDGTSAPAAPATPSTPLPGSHSYAMPGTYSVTLSVSDKDGGTGTSAKVTVIVANDPPVANANGPYSGAEGALIQFSSLGSNDPDGQTLTYSWNFGDGTTSTSANPKKAYGDNGEYIVTLTVKDPTGGTATSTTTATVTNVAPTATLTASTTVAEGTAYTVSLSGTDAGSKDRSTLQYQLDCGQGAGWTPWSTTVKSISCPSVPDQGPVFTVQGQVKDKDGDISVIYTKTVTVTNAAPVATLTATSATSFAVGGSLSVSGNFTDKGVGDGPWTYTITWGDGTTSTGEASAQSTPIPYSHTYTKSGTFSATLSVRDKDGATGTSAKITVTVSP